MLACIHPGSHLLHPIGPGSWCSSACRRFCSRTRSRHSGDRPLRTAKDEFDCCRARLDLIATNSGPALLVRDNGGGESPSPCRTGTGWTALTSMRAHPTPALHAHYGRIWKGMARRLQRFEGGQLCTRDAARDAIICRPCQRSRPPISLGFLFLFLLATFKPSTSSKAAPFDDNK